MENFERLLKKFDELGLDESEYVILGSWVLATRNIRDCNDLDILVLPKIYEKLLEKYPEQEWAIVWQGIEISYKLKSDFSEAEFFANSELINWYRFLTIEKLLEFKQALWREKDEQDIILIEKYLSQIVSGSGAQMNDNNLPII